MAKMVTWLLLIIALCFVKSNSFVLRPLRSLTSTQAMARYLDFHKAGGRHGLVPVSRPLIRTLISSTKENQLKKKLAKTKIMVPGTVPGSNENYDPWGGKK